MKRGGRMRLLTGLAASVALVASGCSLRDSEGLQSANVTCDHDCDGDGSAQVGP